MIHKRLRILINYFVGPAIFLWLAISIYHQIQQQQNVYGIWKNIASSFGIIEWGKISIVLFLMLINWGLEARKWQLLVHEIENISFFTAFKAIFSGEAFAFGTINGVGEYIGRSIYMHEGNRIRSISVTMVGSLAQLIITVTMGTIGLLYLRYFFNFTLNPFSELSIVWLDGLIYILIIIGVLMVSLYFSLSWVTKTVEKIPWIAKYSFFIQKVEDFHWKELTRILNLSFARYLVFISQYLLLLQVFKVDASYIQEFWLLGIMFLALAIVPSITLAEIGLRGKLSIALLGLISTNTIGIILTATGVWIINKVVPAVVGSIFVLGIRLFKK